MTFVGAWSTDTEIVHGIHRDQGKKIRLKPQGFMQPSLSSSFCGDDAPVFEQPWARRPLYVALNCSSGYSLASAANASTLTLSNAPVSNEDLLRVSHSSKLLEHMHDKSGGVKKIRNSTGWRRVHLVKSCDQTRTHWNNNGMPNTWSMWCHKPHSFQGESKRPFEAWRYSLKHTGVSKQKLRCQVTGTVQTKHAA